MRLRVAAHTASEQYTYSNTLSLFVHRPASQKPRASAILLVHGGAWTEGDASWVNSEAKRFTKMGMVAVTVEYRLAGAKTSPLESVMDVKRAIRWIRDHAIALKIDPAKVAVYGVSAGGHIATESYLWPRLPRPNAILLMSPNLSVSHSKWFRRLTWKHVDPSKLSPLDNLQRHMPPVCIVHGTADTRASFEVTKKFQEISTSLGNFCELHSYPDYGHLLVAPGKDDRSDSPDVEAENNAFRQFEDFLTRIFFL